MKKLIDFLNDLRIPHYTGFYNKKTNGNFALIVYPRSFSELRQIAKFTKKNRLTLMTCVRGNSYSINN